MPSGYDDSDDPLYLSVEVSSTDTNTEDESDNSTGDLGEDNDNTEEVIAVEDESTIDDEGTDTEDYRQEQNSNASCSSDTSVNNPKWNNQRLFPPSAKSRSKAWMFGGFRKDSAGQLILKETVCGICGKIQKYRNSPTNLDQHIQSMHSLHYSRVEDQEGLKKETSIADYFKKKSGTIPKYRPNHPKQKALKSKLVEWVVKNNRSILEVEDPKLVEAFEISDPKLKVPGRKVVNREIEKLFKKKKEEFEKDVAKIDSFAGNNDAGSSSNSKSFVAINVSYVTEDFELKKKIIDVVEMPEDKNAGNYRARVDKTEESHGIAGKVFMYTTDNENTMKAAFGVHERNGCFAHIESKASKKALDNQKSLKKLRLKLRKISKKPNKSSKFKYALSNQQKTRGLRQMTLKQEVKTRFTATHTMIRSFLNDPKEGNKDRKEGEDYVDMRKVKENIKAVNAAMVDAKFPKKDLEKLEINMDDINKMIKLVPILDTLEEGITLLGAEKYATASSVLPFLSNLYQVLEADEDDPYYLAKFKSDFKREMKTRCNSNLNRKTLIKASFLDKRFEKIEKFIEKREAEEVIKEIKSELDDIQAVQAEVMEKNDKENNNEEPPKKKKRFLAVSISDSEDEEVSNAEEEFLRYRAEPKLRSDGCPFEWWRSRKAEYPIMARLARKYLAVSGTSTPAERVISRLGLVLSKRRLRMKGELFSKIMFLSDCV